MVHIYVCDRRNQTTTSNIYKHITTKHLATKRCEQLSFIHSTETANSKQNKYFVGNELFMTT
jgi:hypothetical protein